MHSAKQVEHTQKSGNSQPQDIIAFQSNVFLTGPNRLLVIDLCLASRCETVTKVKTVLVIQLHYVLCVDAVSLRPYVERMCF